MLWMRLRISYWLMSFPTLKKSIWRRLPNELKNTQYQNGYWRVKGLTPIWIHLKSSVNHRDKWECIWRGTDPNRRKKHNCFNISIQIAEPLASVLYSRMKRLYHTEVWYGRFLLYPLEGGESDVLIAVIIIVTTNHYFIHSMPSWHVAYIAENRAVKRYGFSLLWWHAPRRHENGPQTGISRTGWATGKVYAMAWDSN